METDKAKLRVIGGRKATDPEIVEGSPGCRNGEKETGSPWLCPKKVIRFLLFIVITFAWVRTRNLGNMKL